MTVGHLKAKVQVATLIMHIMHDAACSGLPPTPWLAIRVLISQHPELEVSKSGVCVVFPQHQQLTAREFAIFEYMKMKLSFCVCSVDRDHCFPPFPIPRLTLHSSMWTLIERPAMWRCNVRMQCEDAIVRMQCEDARRSTSTRESSSTVLLLWNNVQI